MAKKELQPYTIKEASYSYKISYACKDNLWNTFEHSLTVEIKDDAVMEDINKVMWEKVLCEVENKIEEATKLYT